jgi:multiple sugar transport system permease protein
MQRTISRSASARSGRVGREIGAISLNVFTTLMALMFMFPFFWTASSALKTGWELIEYPPRMLPRTPQWGNFHETWSAIQFNLFFANSTIVTILSVIGTIFSSFIVAYGFARFRFPGRDILFLLCLSGMMMPVYVTIIPLFTLFRAIRWTDTLKPLIVPSYFGGAFAIFLLRQFIMTIPYELDESALLDGASSLTILVRIILPNCKPALATIAIFAFMGNWNEFLGPLIFLDSVRNFTLPMGLWFLRSYLYDPGVPRDHLLMAGSLITTLPVLIVFVAAQRYFIEGIVMSGIKG